MAESNQQGCLFVGEGVVLKGALISQILHPFQGLLKAI